MLTVHLALSPRSFPSLLLVWVTLVLAFPGLVSASSSEGSGVDLNGLSLSLSLLASSTLSALPAMASALLGKRSHDAMTAAPLADSIAHHPLADPAKLVAGRLPAPVLSRRGAKSPVSTPTAAALPTPLPLPLLEQQGVPETPADDSVAGAGAAAAAAAAPDIDDDTDNDCYVPQLPEDDTKPAAKRARVAEPSPRSLVKFRVITVLRQSVNLCIYRCHDVARVKQLLAPVTGIPVEKMALVFQGRVLDDQSAMADTGIQDKSIVLVRFSRAEPTISLQVRTLSGLVGHFVVGPGTKVSELKQRIFDKDGLDPAKQGLLWNAQRLDDNRALGSYNMGDSATIMLLPSLAASSS